MMAASGEIRCGVETLRRRLREGKHISKPEPEKLKRKCKREGGPKLESKGLVGADKMSQKATMTSISSTRRANRPGLVTICPVLLGQVCIIQAISLAHSDHSLSF
jgi:hypothetical protein